MPHQRRQRRAPGERGRRLQFIAGSEKIGPFPRRDGSSDPGKAHNPTWADNRPRPAPERPARGDQATSRSRAIRSPAWTDLPDHPEVTSMKTLSVIALVALGGSTCIGADLPRSSPEAEGVSSSAILSFVEAVDKDIDSMNSFMLLRHGHVVAEGWWSPYDAEAPHSLYSLSKSFTSTAVGLAISEGKLGLDDEVLGFFPEDAPTE